MPIDLGHDFGRTRVIADIRDEGQGFLAEFTDFRSRADEITLDQVDNHDIEAMAGEIEGEASADAATAAGDDRNLPLSVRHRNPPSQNERYPHGWRTRHRHEP
ncbi:hypothetical protein D3C80_1925480 [compost metagenome]